MALQPLRGQGLGFSVVRAIKRGGIYTALHGEQILSWEACSHSEAGWFYDKGLRREEIH